MSENESTSARASSRADIIEAAALLLRNQGIRSTTTRAVAQAAGVQAPAIYRLFGDKEGLMDAVAEHAMAGYVASTSADALAADDDVLADLRAGWRAHVTFGLANPDLYALLITPRSGPPSAASAAGIEVLRFRVHRVAAAGHLRVDEDRALSMVHAAGTGTVLTLSSVPENQRDTGMIDAMFDAVAAQIITDRPTPTSADLLTLTVTFGAACPTFPRSVTQSEL